MSNVAVTNKGAEQYERRYDGKPYSFPPGKEVIVSEDAAAFLFGYGGSDEERFRILVRNGWQRNGTPGDPFGPEAAAKKLAAFVFKAAPDDPAPPKKKPLIAPSQMTDDLAASEGEGTLHLPKGKATREQPRRDA